MNFCGRHGGQNINKFYQYVWQKHTIQLILDTHLYYSYIMLYYSYIMLYLNSLFVINKFKYIIEIKVTKEMFVLTYP